jgi:hypothetical protein
MRPSSTRAGTYCPSYLSPALQQRETRRRDQHEAEARPRQPHERRFRPSRRFAAPEFFRAPLFDRQPRRIDDERQDQRQDDLQKNPRHSRDADPGGWATAASPVNAS